MEELPGLKGMKKRLNGEHKKVIRTRADEGAALFAQILELIPCSEEEAEADRRAAEPRLGKLMGILGMLLFIPLCSVLYALFRSFVKGRLAEKKVPSSRWRDAPPDPKRK